MVRRARTDAARAFFALMFAALLRVGVSLSAGAVVVAGISLTASTSLGAVASFAAVGKGPSPAPRFKVKDVSGRTLDLDVLVKRGPVLIDFWATWCKPCLEAVPELERWYETYGPRGLTVIGVSVDGPRNLSKVRPFARRLGITYPIVTDEDERLRHLYQIIAMPTAVLIDRDGNVSTVRLGYRPGEGEEMEGSIVALLPAPSVRDSSTSPTDSAATDTSGTREK